MRVVRGCGSISGMKTIRGDYPGASEFAAFEKPVHQMSKDEMQGLLECILHRASPGEPNAEVMMSELAIAEASALQPA